MAALKAYLSKVGGLSAVLSGGSTMRAGMTIPKEIGSVPYTGDYEFTPAEETQTIEIAAKRATENITINPIPKNYGLITWDGSVITVS